MKIFEEHPHRKAYNAVSIAIKASTTGAKLLTEWIRCDDGLPNDGLVVETKVDDKDGVRNVQDLKRSGRLWFFPDNSMYVYYTPTHWRPKQ